MSVVNKMLQDLESRQDEDNLEADYKPQADAKRTRNLVLFIVAIVLVAVSYFTLRAIGFDKVGQQARQFFTQIGIVEPEVDQSQSAQPKVSVNQALEQIMPSKPLQPVVQEQKVVSVKQPETVELADVLTDEMNEAMGNKPSTDKKSQRKPEEVTRLALIPEKKESEVVTGSDEESEPTEFTVNIAENTPEEKASYWREQARRAISEGNESEAVEALKALQELEPEDVRIRRKLASILYASGAVDEAKIQLQQGLQLSTDAHGLRLMLSRLYFQQQQSQQAFNLLDKVQPEIELYPDFYSFKASLAQTLELNQHAYLSYQKLVAYEPHKAKWWLGMAIALDRQSVFPQALRAYQQAAELQQLSSSAQDFVKQRIEALGG